MVTKQPPCNGCPDRRAGCHGACPKYQEFRTEHEAERARIRQTVIRERDYDDFKIKTVDTTKRRLR